MNMMFNGSDYSADKDINNDVLAGFDKYFLGTTMATASTVEGIWASTTPMIYLHLTFMTPQMTMVQHHQSEFFLICECASRYASNGNIHYANDGYTQCDHNNNTQCASWTRTWCAWKYCSWTQHEWLCWRGWQPNGRRWNSITRFLVFIYRMVMPPPLFMLTLTQQPIETTPPIPFLHGEARPTL